MEAHSIKSGAVDRRASQAHRLSSTVCQAARTFCPVVSCSFPCHVGTSGASTWCLDLGCSVKLLQAVTQQIVVQITVVQCEYLSRPEGLSRSCCVHMHHSSNVIADAPVLMCFHASYRYGTDGWEVVFGYDQEKMMGERAGAALVLDLMDVDKKQSTPAMSMT